MVPLLHVRVWFVRCILLIDMEKFLFNKMGVQEIQL